MIYLSNKERIEANRPPMRTVARGQIVLLDCEADRDQRPERERGVNVVCEAGYPQEGGKMTDVSKTIFSGDWELYPCKGNVTIQDFEHCKIVLTEAE